MTKLINQQTKGHIICLPLVGGTSDFPHPAQRLVTTAGKDVARVLWPKTYPEQESVSPKTNGRLFAASYNAFDKAGRELGIDAAELAERIDIVELIRAANLIRAEWSQSPARSATAGQNAILAALDFFTLVSIEIKP